MKQKIEKFKLRGWDWTELGVLWGFKEELTDKVMARKIRKYMWDSYDVSNDKNPATEKVATDIRQFLKLLTKGPTYQVPVWKGLMTVKNNYTLFQFTDILLECMWN